MVVVVVVDVVVDVDVVGGVGVVGSAIDIYIYKPKFLD